MKNRDLISEKYIFLLGGHDLEMLEIKRVLEEKKLTFYDHNLSWGARLSAYLSTFDNTHTYVGIELNADCKLPDHYIAIDHHNEKSSLPSSIEQIADLLGIALTQEQQYIAANDSGYIPALKEMGASPETIQDIRQRDRQAQNVTQEDERLAELSIKENRSRIGNVTIVESLTPKFSPITDRLFPYHELLIKHEKSFTYFGKRKELFVKKYQHLIDQKKAYSGGNSSGFFGFDGSTSTEKEANLLYNDFIQSIITMDTLSYHIFMFPFRWVLEDKKEEPYSERFNLDSFKINDDSQWENITEPCDKDKKIEKYNEKNYFYEFVHQALYEEKGEKKRITNTEVRHFERKEISTTFLTYEIGMKDKPSYKLHISEINLDLYKTGTGILSFHLANTEYPNFEDIKKINQFGRRVFPPFLGKDKGVADTKGAELEDYIRITGLQGVEDRYFEDFTEYTTQDDWKPAKFINNLITDLNKDLEIKPVIDDRMFTMCWAFNNKLSFYFKDNKLFHEFLKSDNWHEYLYLDSDTSTCQNDQMQERLLKDHTYPRWQKKGTLYGITRYSMMAISEDSWFPREIAFTHFRTIYAKMVMLCLIQRASVLQFSGEVTSLSSLNDKEIKRSIEPLDSFYKSYVQFINKVYYREISAQEQAIELYDMLQTNMNIERHSKELEKEINELYSYVNLVRANQTNERILVLSILGGAIVIPNFLFNLLNSQFFKNLPPRNSFGFGTLKLESFWFLAFVVVASYLTTDGLLNFKKRTQIGLEGKCSVVFGLFLLLFYLLVFQFTLGK